MQLSRLDIAVLNGVRPAGQWTTSSQPRHNDRMESKKLPAKFDDLPDHALLQIAGYLVEEGIPWSAIPEISFELRLLCSRFGWAMTCSLLRSVVLDIDPRRISRSQGFLSFRRGLSSSTYPTWILSITQATRPLPKVSKKGKENGNKDYQLEADVQTSNKHVLQAINACRAGLKQLQVQLDEGTSRRLDGFSYLAERGTSFFTLPNLRKIKLMGDHVNGLLPALCIAAPNLSTMELDRASPTDKAWVSRKYFVESSPFACIKVVELDTLIIGNIAWFADQFNMTRFNLQPKNLILNFDLGASLNLEDIMWGVASLKTCGVDERLEKVMVTSDKGLCKKDADDIVVAFSQATDGREIRYEWDKVKLGKSSNKKKKNKGKGRQMEVSPSPSLS